MKALIGIVSYQGDAVNGNHDAIRNTWGRDVKAAGADLRFFVGRRGPDYRAKPDEVLIPWEQTRTCEHPWYHSQEGCCVDFWINLTNQILQWSLAEGYDYTYTCENDTFLVPRKLMASGFEHYDFSSESFQPLGSLIGSKTLHQMYGHNLYPWPDAGVGYFTSRKAAKAILLTPPNHWSIGMFAAQALGPYIETGELTIGYLPTGTAWHFRTEIGDGYSPGSPWQKDMYLKYGN